MKGLIIKDPWITKILNNEKIWEIRSRRTHIRGYIYLIKSGSKTIVGKGKLIDCIELEEVDYINNGNKHQIPLDIKLNYDKKYAWVLSEVQKFKQPIKYNHPKGAIIWVNIDQKSYYEFK